MTRFRRCLLFALLLAGCETNEPESVALRQTMDATAPQASAESGLRRTAYLLPIESEASEPPTTPPVLLSKGHAALCHVEVGDPMPPIELPVLSSIEPQMLSDLFGEQATVVVFWSNDRRMARAQLADMVPDVVQPFGDLGVNVVGIAVNVSQGEAQTMVQEAGALFTHLLDAQGVAFAQVGSEKLPRTYLLDADGRVLWFDIEYSLATRRELNQALRAVTHQD